LKSIIILLNLGFRPRYNATDRHWGSVTKSRSIMIRSRLSRSRCAPVLPAALVLTVCAIEVPEAARSVFSGSAGGFIANEGQLDGAVAYYATDLPWVVFLTREALVLESPGPPGSAWAVWIGLSGCSADVEISADHERTASYHFYSGADASTWRISVRSFDRVTYRDAWPGVDLVFRIQGSTLAYEAVGRAPSPDGPRFDYLGAESIETAQGVVRVNTPRGTVVHERVAGIASASGRFRFESVSGPGDWPGEDPPGEDHNDEQLIWGTFLGGSEEDVARRIRVGTLGVVWTVGRTYSPDFPTTPGAQDPSFNGDYDIFISRIDGSGAVLLSSTFLGGSGEDHPYCFNVDAGGRGYLTGFTSSPDFPVTDDAYDRSHNGDRDVCVVKLGLAGTIEWSTYVGGSSQDEGLGVGVRVGGDVVVAASSFSSDFPVTPGAYDVSFNGYSDAAILTLSRDGRDLLASSYLGSSDMDLAEGLALDRDGNPVICGLTNSPGFPTTPDGYDLTFGGDSDGFVTKLSADASSLMASTFLGGSRVDAAYDIVLDDEDNAIISGHTDSPDYPTTSGAFDRTYNGGAYPSGDVFASKLDATGASLLWSTFVGGALDEVAYDIRDDEAGNVVLVGFTDSADFPTVPGAYDESHNGGRDAFLVRVDPSGSDLTYGTFIGAAALDWALGVAVDGEDNLLLAGTTRSSDFPTTSGSYDTVYSGGGDAFIARLAIPPALAVDDPGGSVAILDLRVAPNPLRDAARMAFELKRGTFVTAAVFDFAGRRVSDVVSEFMSPGHHVVAWEGRTSDAARVASGVYYIRLDGGDWRETRRIVVLR
jgi:hypothetical protein